MSKKRYILTKREKEVLCLLGDGKNTEEIAESLIISTSTVQGYVTRILFKTNAYNRTHAVVNALRKEEITIDQIPDSSI